MGSKCGKKPARQPGLNRKRQRRAIDTRIELLRQIIKDLKIAVVERKEELKNLKAQRNSL